MAAGSYEEHPDATRAFEFLKGFPGEVLSAVQKSVLEQVQGDSKHNMSVRALLVALEPITTDAMTSFVSEAGHLYLAQKAQGKLPRSKAHQGII